MDRQVSECSKAKTFMVWKICTFIDCMLDGREVIEIPSLKWGRVRLCCSSRCMLGHTWSAIILYMPVETKQVIGSVMPGLVKICMGLRSLQPSAWLSYDGSEVRLLNVSKFYVFRKIFLWVFLYQIHRLVGSSQKFFKFLHFLEHFLKLHPFPICVVLEVYRKYSLNGSMEIFESGTLTNSLNSVTFAS